MKKHKGKLIFIFLLLVSAAFVFPVFIVLMNSFKSKLYITSEPFKFPTAETFAGIFNYTEGLAKTGYFTAFATSVFVTVLSVGAIVVFTSMTAWYLTRVKNKFTKFCYYAFVFSMVVPFQMVMFTTVKTANVLSLDSPLGLVILYLGFGSGLSVFMFSGFVKSIPKEIEEAAMIDGCGPIRTFFLVVFPLMKPTTITVAILNAMWIWNDYLLPYLVIGSDYKTIPIAIQYLRGGYGSIDMGAMMAMLVLSIIPIVIFYLLCQKHIIKGVVAGAVKG